MKWILLIFIAVTHTGCTLYQYHTLSSSLPETRKNEFTFENDSITVTYRIQGNGGPIQIEVFNKLKEPIYIDWKKSALIIKDKMVPYIEEEAHFTAAIDYNTVSGRVEKKETEDLVLPGVSRNKRLVIVRAENFPISSALPYESVSFGSGKANRYTFTPRTTPLAFRSYLTVLDNTKTKEKVFDHEFWISEIHQTSQNLDWSMEAGQLYTSEPSGDGTFLGIVLLGGLTFLLIEAAPEE